MRSDKDREASAKQFLHICRAAAETYYWLLMWIVNVMVLRQVFVYVFVFFFALRASHLLVNREAVNVRERASAMWYVVDKRPPGVFLSLIIAFTARIMLITVTFSTKFYAAWYRATKRVRKNFINSQSNSIFGFFLFSRARDMSFYDDHTNILLWMISHIYFDWMRMAEFPKKINANWTRMTEIIGGVLRWNYWVFVFCPERFYVDY